MGKCLSKSPPDVLTFDAIDIRHVQPIHTRYASSRLIDVVTEQAILDYRLSISLSPTHASSNDSSLRGRSPAHSHRKFTSSNHSTPMAQQPRTNVRLNINSL